MNPSSKQRRIAFGYNRAANGQIVVHEGQAATVTLIFSYYVEGKGLAEITDILEGLGIPSPQNKPRWGKQTLSNILSNIHYVGSDVYPAIIDRDTFDRVQAILEFKKK